MIKMMLDRVFPVVRRLRLRLPMQGTGLIPGQGTKTCYMVREKKKMLAIHCNGNTQGEQDQITKTARRKTFRAKHTISLVCRILQMAHSIPTTAQEDCT